MDIRIVYVVHGDIAESGTSCSVLIDCPLSFEKIEKNFPFEGIYHFRIRVFQNKSDYIWMDVSEYSIEALSVSKNESEIFVQALALSLPENYVDDAEYKSYFDIIRSEYLINDRPSRKSAISTPRSSKEADSKSNYTKPIQKQNAAGAPTISMDTVSKTATNIWNTMLNTASNIQLNLSFPLGANYLSDISENNLAELSDDLSTKYNDSVSKHLELLSDLWNGLFPGKLYQRFSDTWKQAGFQKNDPVLDLRNSGILALKAMTYLCHNYSQKTKNILQTQQANTKSNYPFASVGVNLTLLLADILSLRDQR